MEDAGADIKITFGMIVLNGEPFVRYNLSAVYPFAHQIIVVEGACKSSAAVATPDGHSLDGTLETLRAFQCNCDPDSKITIVTAREEGYTDGFWPEKNEMSWAYSRRATGNYLWQLDSDEFYHEAEMTRLVHILRSQRPDMISFPMFTFWGSPSYIVDGFYFIRDKHDEIPRVFAWGQGFSYVTHRPATVVDENGVDLRNKRWLQAKHLKHQKIFLYHYSLLFPHQVLRKVSYYKQLWRSRIDDWEKSVYIQLKRPFRMHNVYQHMGWLKKFGGEHPAAIRTMMADIENGRIQVAQRECRDVERLLASRSYTMATTMLTACASVLAVQPFYFCYRVYGYVSRRIYRLFEAAIIQR